MPKLTYSTLENVIDVLQFYWDDEVKDREYHYAHARLLIRLKQIREKYGSMADRMSEAMKNKGVSLRFLAKETDIPLSTLSNWLNGAIPSDFDAVARLASKLDLSYSYLTRGVEDYEEEQNFSE